MILPDISIRRPVLATVMSLMLVLIGIISYNRLSVREYPKIDTPVVSVRTVFTGASPEIIESQITKPIEDALAGIEGIRNIKSVSREEVSEITVEFVLERDQDAAANDVRDRVSRIKGVLPDDADDPVVAKVDSDANAVIWIAFSSDKHNALEITDYADRYVVDRLQTLPGVASVIIGGERRYAMRIWLDRDKLAARRLTPEDVEDALKAQNLEVPSGRIESDMREFTVLMKTDLRTPDQFNQMILRRVDGYPVRLIDVGHAEIGAADERNAVRVNGNPAVGLGVVKQATANTLEVGRAVKAEIPKINQTLPDGMKLKVAFDSSLFIEKSISSVYKAIAEALVLVVLVIFLFLRSFRATLIPFVTIPVSLVGAFIFLYAMNYSVNILTLLGLVLAIGLVVDDAIVMLENIHRRIEHGMRPLQAALEGSKEIAFAIIAMSLTLAAVFAPLAFVPGNTGRLFSEFALTVAGAVLISGFVALTLTPMMCSKILHHEKKHHWLYNLTEQSFVKLHDKYLSTLQVALNMRWRVIMIGVVFAAIGISLFVFMWGHKRELAPVEDRGILIGITLAPEGATMAYTDKYAHMIESMYAKVPDIKTYFMVVAPGLQRPNPVNFALSFVSLKPWEQRDQKAKEIASGLSRQMFGLPGVFSFVNNPPSLGQSFRSSPVEFVLLGSTYEQLNDAASKFMEKLSSYPGMFRVDSDLKLNKPQLAVTLNRDKVADVGASVASIGHTVETLLGGRQVTRFRQEGEQYDVIVKVADKDRVTPSDLTSIYVRGNNGQLVQLSNLADVKETVAPKELNHFDRLRAVKITAQISPGYSQGQVLDFLEKTAKEVLPPTMQTALDGPLREFTESGSALLFIFLLAVVFIFLVLAAQFESFIDPLIIIFVTVPLALSGAIITMMVIGFIPGIDMTLNVYSIVGLTMLIGLITKHGILIVSFSNDLQDQGKPIREAVIEAAGLRLRPILMTTAAMVFGALPLAIATGAGAEARQSIGTVIIGGLTFGTVFTLFVVPAVYSLVGKRKRPVS